MSASFRFGASGKSVALVIVFPAGVSGLFNADIHRLVREVQESLGGVYVTYALSSGTAPNLRDAMFAARLVGCDSAVVVPAVASAEAISHSTRGSASAQRAHIAETEQLPWWVGDVLLFSFFEKQKRFDLVVSPRR